jgi:hypothetical protein
MKLPELKDGERYVGLYVVDFGDSTSVGFTAGEVAELLESDKFAGIKVYKIYNAYPDGRMELRGVVNDTFDLEMGMFFYAANREMGENDFKQLVDIAISQAPPCRAKVQLAKYDDDRFVTAVIFPAEYNDEFGAWLSDADYKTLGQATGGVDAVREYYEQAPEVIQRHQLLGQSQWHSKTGEELLVATKIAVQR